MKIANLSVIALVVFFVGSQAFALDCTDRVRTKTARSFARRDIDYVQLQIAIANKELERVYYDQLIANLEQQYALYIPASSYAVSIRPHITAELQKRLSRERDDLIRERDSALRNRERRIESARRSFDRTSGRMPSLDCTL